MRKISPILLFVLFFASGCQTRVVSHSKPLKSYSLELYQDYTIQTSDAKEIKMQVLKQDEYNVFGKSKKGEEVVINKSDIREVKKLDLIASIGIALAAIALVIFVPI